MNFRRILLGLFSTSLIALALPAFASAKTETFELSAESPSASFEAKASNGFHFRAFLSGDFAEVHLGKADAETGYSAKARIRHGRYSLNLGKLGTIKVRFVPSGNVKRENETGCKGGPALTRYGTFVGTIRIHGENGYSQVNKKRAKGTVEEAPRRVCRVVTHHTDEHREHFDEPSFVEFEASSTTGHEIDFNTGTELESLDTGSDFSVTMEEDQGPVEITRIAFAHSNAPDTFSFDKGLNSATITPPGPVFSGSATYQRLDDHTTRWEGPLAVTFPGIGPIPLTGRNFTWKLTNTGPFRTS